MTVVGVRDLPGEDHSNGEIQDRPRAGPALLRRAIVLIGEAAAAGMRRGVIVLCPCVRTSVAAPTKRELQDVPTLGVPGRVNELSPRGLPTGGRWWWGHGSVLRFFLFLPIVKAREQCEWVFAGRVSLRVVLRTVAGYRQVECSLTLCGRFASLCPHFDEVGGPVFAYGLGIV